MSFTGKVSTESNASITSTTALPSSRSSSRITSFFKRSSSSASKVTSEKTTSTNPFSKMKSWVKDKSDNSDWGIQTRAEKVVEWNSKGKVTTIKVCDLAKQLGISSSAVLEYEKNNKLSELRNVIEIEKIKELESISMTLDLPIRDVLTHRDQGDLDQYLLDSKNKLKWKSQNGEQVKVTISELSENLGVSKQTVLSYVKSGKLSILRDTEAKSKIWDIPLHSYLNYVKTKGLVSFAKLEVLSLQLNVPMRELIKNNLHDVKDSTDQLDVYLLTSVKESNNNGKMVPVDIKSLAKEFEISELTVLKYVKIGELDKLKEVSRLAKKLDLPVLDVLVHTENENLEAYLFSVEADKIATENQEWAKAVDQKCESIFEKLDTLYQEVNQNKTGSGLSSQNSSGKIEKMSLEDLESIKKSIRSAYLVLGRAAPKDDQILYDLTKKHRIMVRPSGDPNDPIAITGLFGKFLAAGAFGSVFETVDLTKGQWATGDDAILKIPKQQMQLDDVPKMEKDEIIQEHTLIKKIHGEKEVLGIQKPLKVIRNVLTSEVSYCHLGPRYEKDLKGVLSEDGKPSEISLSTSDKMSLSYQLLNGVSHMHRADISHGDIKPGNVFCDFREIEGDATGPRLYLGDFGGGIDHSTKDSETLQVTVTPEYRVSNDSKASQEAHTAGDKLLYKEIEMKGDVFATCSVICSFFTNDLPYDGVPGEGTFQLKENMQQRLEEQGLSKETAKLVIKGLSVDHAERPTAEEIQKAFARDLQDPTKVSRERANLLLQSS